MPDRFIRESALISKSLAQLSHLAERLFWRLTTVADDYGRFSGEPAVIHGRCMPLLEVSLKQVSAALAELSAVDMVRHYEVDGSKYLHFVNWGKYQQTRAKKSKYPDPQASASICKQMSANVPVFVSVSESVCESDLVPTVLVQAEGSDAQAPEAEASPSKPEALKPEDLVEAWNDHLVAAGLSRVAELSPSRRKKATLRLHEHPKNEFWESVFRQIRGSPFLRGLKPGTNGHDKWRASFDWLIDNDVNAVKVYEGRYDGNG